MRRCEEREVGRSLSIREQRPENPRDAEIGQFYCGTGAVPDSESDYLNGVLSPEIRGFCGCNAFGALDCFEVFCEKFQASFAVSD